MAFLDVLRVFATCAVVLMHTVTGVTGTMDLSGYARRPGAYQAIVDLTAWSVPVFLMISGYLFLRPEKEIRFREMLFKYCRRILLALILFGIPYSFLELLAQERVFRLEMLWEAVVNTALGHSWAHMWYLYTILILYALTPLMKWVLDRAPRGTVYVVLLVLAVGCGFLPFLEKLTGENMINLPETGIYLFYYLCGYVFACRKKTPGTGEGVIWLSAAGIIGIFEIFSRLLPGVLKDFSVVMGYSYPVTVIQAVCVFAGFQSLKIGTEKTGLFERVGELCFGIYLTHPVFLNVFYKFLGITLLDMSFLTGLLLFFGMALMGAALLSFILRLIPVMRKYVL